MSAEILIDTEAREHIFDGAEKLAFVVSSTMGPHGQDKFLVPVGSEGDSSDVSVSNDGATILKNIHVDNPSAKMLVETSLAQDESCGDGTSGVVLLSSAMLKQARLVLSATNAHSGRVVSGIQLACRMACDILQESAVVSDSVNSKEYLIKMCETTLASKVTNVDTSFFAELAVELVTRLENPAEIENIAILKCQGSDVRESCIAEGFILPVEFECDRPLSNPKIILVNAALDTDRLKFNGVQLNANSYDTVGKVAEAEHQSMSSKCEAIAETGCNLLINRQLIYDGPKSILSKLGVETIEHADFEGIQRLSKVLGGSVISQFTAIQEGILGTCREVSALQLAGNNWVHFSGCPKQGASTLILRGSSVYIMDELERSIHDAIANVSSTLSDRPSFVGGGGSAELKVYRQLKILRDTIEPSLLLGYDCFVEALKIVPLTLCQNAGLDHFGSSELIEQCSRQDNEKVWMGIDLENEEVVDMFTEGVIESLHTKMNQIKSAVDVSCSLLRVDCIIRCPPLQRH